MILRVTWRDLMLAGMITWTLSSCHAKPHAHPVSEPKPARKNSLLSPLPLSGADAFDVVPSADGAVLVWAKSPTEIFAQAMTRDGSAKGAAQLVSHTDNAPSEVVAAAAAGRLGVAWIEERPEHVLVRGTFGSVTGGAFAPFREMGASVASRPEGRGRLALSATDDGDMQLLMRTTPWDCQASEGACERYMHRRLGTQETANSSLDTMEIAHPCEPLVVGAAWTKGTGFYSVCSEDPSRAARVFSLRPEISYASVNDGPSGCTPVALVPADDGAWSISRCRDGNALTTVQLDGRSGGEYRVGVGELTCTEGRATLAWKSFAEMGQPTLELRAPRTRLESVLPFEFSHPKARAVWTGSALLVAYPNDGQVYWQRWTCTQQGTEIVGSHEQHL